MSDILELVAGVESALKDLKLALQAKESSETVTNQKSNEEINEFLNVRF